ncbi:MAG: potassium-transporting ATPase subunit KdpC [Planctomycetales bacterium]|nr:potassium-transporting ATPase subunit KdpC [Planctomycetales bacterium]
MLRQLASAALMLVLLTILTGLIYPLAVTGVALVAFPHEARGSLIIEGDKVLGSELIGQPFNDPKFFWGRLSGTSPFPYNSGSSSGSNLGPLNPALQDATKGRVQALRDADLELKGAIPVDLITASGSGLDPEISPAAAAIQVRRVAKARGLTEEEVAGLVTNHTQSRQLGILGEPRVNVLELNLALDRQAAVKTSK